MERQINRSTPDEMSVTFLSEGYRLLGNLHLPREKAPVILFSHGLASSKDSEKWVALACRLYDEGYAVLRFSYRGCGLGEEWSEGTSEDTTLTSRVRDYEAALEFLRSSGKVDANRIGVIGSSLGVCTAIAAGSPLVKNYVFLATPPRMIATPEMKESFEKKGYFEFANSGDPIPFRITRALFDDFQKYNMFELIKRIQSPVLMVQGSKDQIPIKDVRRLYDGANEPRRLEIIEGGSHSFIDNPEHLAKVIDLTIDWFKRYL
ncbi:MAG: alpha/beta fold hydrolase [Dehalococcoidia bacterium]|nr:alpha/beta fold hydrolase [Dehalococcoidia bacterium]